MTGVAVPRRLMLGLLLGYSLFLAFVLLTPTSDVPSAGVARLTDLALRWGLPHVTPVRVEFLCNVVLLVPFAVLGSLALPRWSWQDWTAWGFLLAGAVDVVGHADLEDRRDARGRVAGIVGRARDGRDDVVAQRVRTRP